MRQNNLSIHSENILPIIKKWLYSDKDIFIRELVSNATDALNKIRILQEGTNLSQEENLLISISIQKADKTITISDTGIGMTEEEVEKYIAQIAFSGAEEFVSKYQSATEKDPIIGHFGLGFYSAYMVASKVDIDTLSYLPDSVPVSWSCDGSSSYTLDQGKREKRGTSIILHISPENEEYLQESKLKELLQRYCTFMPFPIELNGKAIGNKAPLWMKAPHECKDSDYLEFHRQLFPMDPDPLFWVHLNVDYPFNLKGILFFPKIKRRVDTQESSIKLFCNRVFVSDQCKDILPDYLMVLKGAIDSADIPLNVSRSYLQVDQNVRSLSSHISKKISDRLASLYKMDREKYIASWSDFEMLLKLGSLQDEKFYDRVKDLIIWKKSESEWTTVQEILDKTEDKKVYYTTKEHATPLVQLYKTKNIDIIFAPSPLDTAMLQFLESKLSISFQRIDGSLNDHLLDPSKEKTLLDAEGKSESAKIAQFIKNALPDSDTLSVEAKSLSSEEIPALLLFDEQERRLRDYLLLTQGKDAGFKLSKKTFVVNTNHRLIHLLSQIHHKTPEMSKKVIQGIYDLSLLSQRELDSQELDAAIHRQTEILESFASSLSE